ncbi:MAG: HD domain-containing phosphohydrolase [Trueperaceae bacterium]|nr:HD domain-containing phosphohydrolase [Trueperaceae bacterium]
MARHAAAPREGSPPDDPHPDARTHRAGSVRLAGYRAVLLMGMVVMVAMLVVNALAPAGEQRPILFLFPSLTLLVVVAGWWRARRSDEVAGRDAEVLAVATLPLYVGALSVNGDVSVPFVTAGIVIAYLLLRVPLARWLSAGFLASTLVGLLAFDAEATVIRTPVVAFGIAAILDVVMRGLDGIAARLADRNRRLAEENVRLDDAVRDRHEALLRSQDALTVAMASLADQRSSELGSHTARTGRLMRLLARAYVARTAAPPSHDAVTETWIDDVSRAAPLHDIGKIGVPDAILKKRDTLTDGEFEAMKAHCRIGRDVIADVRAQVGREIGFLTCAERLVYGHHERFDGGGYPEGLAGEAIPVEARLMAVVDVYDALISERSYKPAMPHDEAATRIRRGAGSHFDPEVVEAFFDVEEAIAATA